ncbi:LLM class flavin-dependent oxidoreductase [Rhizosaccharibacter radicis]|uniref:LLM class flavin-dependent oxidoreductase n=1 Tax=Rhizosaccharibacter radicis TaxID=2782605 RepID=A0ABT1W1F5_9PROT|nr:LLM class flavin-dependent oxidoreductase [Acetobacteraceae bacterium KSS12]
MGFAKPRQLRLNAFAMHAPTHQSPGLWRHPRDRSREVMRLPLWLELARLWEDGLFDAVFLADVLGPYDVYGGDARGAIATGAQLPAHDPMLLVPAMASVTSGLGFGVTASLSYEPPFLMARRFSTLDHLTDGRIGWNIVTGYLDSAARAMGRDRQLAHDDRYRLAEDYMEAVRALWERSWDDDAILADPARGWADPDRVRVVHHHGPELRMDALHLCAPSPQRTPLLFQAGSSPAGLGFAARHAECVFVSGPSIAVVAPRVRRLRDALRAAGRDPYAVKVLALATPVVADTDAQARELLAEYRSYVDPRGALVLLSGWLGVDFAPYRLDEPVRFIESDAGRSAMENFTRADPDRNWTVREVAEHVGIGGAGPVFHGSARTVADEMARWQRDADVDGFNLAYAVLPETFEQVVHRLVPVLQEMELFKTAYAPGTLRQKLATEIARS